ncbi:putative nitrogen permease regulator 3 [Septoria linicola]|nr:putative nitrogen permease regulator 3 [Septoria linicola]
MAPKHGARHGEGLVAILLITRTRPGPRLVFHYPENPSHSTKSAHENIDNDDSETESDDDQDRQQGSQHITSSIVPDDARRNLDGAPRPYGHFVLGRSMESLEKVLSPGRWCDRKKFEINLNGLTFVGHPVYASEDGDWVPKKTAPPSKSTSRDATDMAEPDLDSHDLTSPRPPGKAHDFSHVPDSFESQENVPFATSMQTTSSTGSDPTTDGNMAMFHVVFALRGNGVQSQSEIQAVYHEVIKKLSRALHYCQKQANYVGSQSRRILALTAKAKQTHGEGSDLWTQLVENSELAWAIKEVFDRLSRVEVAGIRLNGMGMALRLNDTTEHDKTNAKLEPLSAILLLESKEQLLEDLSHPEALPLAAFIREHTPTKSLEKHAAYVGTSVDDILYLASHLIKWRKARLITPLHQRNTYIVAHTAPVAELQEHISAYHRLFPTLPTLPNMLKVLSGKPIKYGLLIPSRDHRTAYMKILSYLVRHKFVIQLRAFGWLNLPHNLLDNPQPRDSVADRRQHAARYSLLSTRTRAVDDDVISVGSEQTAIAAPSSPLSKQSRRLSRETQSSAQNSTDKQKKVPILIADPHEPGEEHAKLFDALKTSIQDSEMRQALPQLILHLDGKHAFEEIAAKEGWKRAKVEEWLADLESKEYLITARYIQ